jgi:tRNA(Ile)-lysidine synthase
MNIVIEPGRYVVAVSGGVDSMALLHLLLAQSGLQLTVAHFDHGIRPDSRQDRLLVQKIAKEYGLSFVYAEGGLGPAASEAAARQARYDFLHTVRQKAGANAVVTAHHKDDVLETALINMVRGTGRKGVTSLKSTDIVKRPLLQVTKSDIQGYARKHDLQWREDSTNSDGAYLRNHIRRNILQKLDPADREKLHAHISTMRAINREMDELLLDYLQRYSFGQRLMRHPIIMLPHAAALEVMAAWLRNNNVRTFDKKMLERLVYGAKIHSIGRQIPITNSVSLRISGEFLALEHTER